MRSPGAARSASAGRAQTEKVTAGGVEFFLHAPTLANFFACNSTWFACATRCFVGDHKVTRHMAQAEILLIEKICKRQTPLSDCVVSTAASRLACCTWRKAASFACVCARAACLGTTALGRVHAERRDGRCGHVRILGPACSCCQGARQRPQR